MIPNGVDAAEYSRDDKTRHRLRGQWGIAPREILLAFVGRLGREKGLETLLAAMQLLAGRDAAAKLIVAGDGPRRKMLQQFMASDPFGERIRWLGFVTDVRGVLSAADIFVMPSRWEGFGLAAAEAMAAGLPVVATSVPGLKDLVVDGRTGLLIEKDDATALAGCIEQLCQDAGLRRRLGEAGRRRVIEQFDVATTIASHERLYLKLAGQPARP